MDQRVRTGAGQEREDNTKCILVANGFCVHHTSQLKKTESPDHVGLPVGQYAFVRRELEQERAAEYRALQEQVTAAVAQTLCSWPLFGKFLGWTEQGLWFLSGCWRKPTLYFVRLD